VSGHHWVVIGIETGVFWPTTETTVEFDGHQITLRPETKELAPSVIMQCKSVTMDEGMHLLRRFLSSLSWVHGAPIREIAAGGGSHPHGIGKGAGARLINPNFTADYLPVPKEPKAKLALALYREALNVNSVAYQFLGFAKVLNILYEKGKDQKEWINKNVDLVTDHRAKERLAELRKQGVDIGDYLYTSGRCAIAHAYATPVVDPEDPEENRRLYKDLPLVQALAEDLIERELGIKSAQTVWREHLYELGGFRLLLGDEAVDRIKNLQPIDLRNKRSWPRLSIRIRNQAIFPALDKLKVTESLIIGNGGIELNCESEDGLVQAELFLDFKNERLVMGPEGKVQIKDNRTATSVRHAIDYMRFRKHYYLNGELEIYDADHETLLGRCDPFMPVNIMPVETAQNIDKLIAEMEKEAERREQASAAKEENEQPAEQKDALQPDRSAAENAPLEKN
jgi:hypothetical protein